MRDIVRLLQRSHDADTGQVFTETIVPAQICTHQNKHDTPHLRPRTVNPRGARSLQDVSTATFCRNMDLCNKDSLKGVDQRTIHRLWTVIQHNRADSVHAWQIFASTGYFDSVFNKRTRMDCIKPQCLATVARSPEIGWLTDLTIDGAGLDPEFVLSISNIPNLCNIHVQMDRVSSDRSSFSDRTLRSWAADAQERGALSRLQAMYVDGQQDITIHVLQYLYHFPALDMFTARDCGINTPDTARSREKMRASGRAHGWIVYAKSPLQHFIFHRQQQRQTVPGSTRESWNRLVKLYTWHRRDQGDRSIPVLDVTSGSLNNSRDVSDLEEDDFCGRVCEFSRDWNYEPIAVIRQVKPGRKRRKIELARSKEAHNLMCPVW